MAINRIIMRLARNPGTEFADGDDHRGYTLTAALTADGKLDEAGVGGATVRRFAPDEDAEEGVLKRRGAGKWVFAFGDGEDDDEAAPRLNEHTFAVGEYVSVADEGGRLLAYKVVEVTPV